MYLALVFALLCLTFLGCAEQTTQPKITSGKTEVELRRERKARADEEKKAKREAADRAKREAAARAKAEREEKARVAKEMKAKREAADRAKREAAAQAKREAAARAKAERAEKARASEEMKAKREAADRAKREAAAQAKREATARAKAERAEKARAAEEMKAKREAAAKAKREAAEQAKRVAAAKAKAEREEKARYAKLEAETKKKVKADIAQAESEKRAMIAELDAKAKQQAKVTKTERSNLKSRFDRDKARLAVEYKQAKAAAGKDKARLDAENKEYKRKVARLEAEYKQAIATLEDKADAHTARNAAQKKQILADCKEKVARINIRLKQQREALRIAKLELPEDTSLRMAIREVNISGNTLITTDELLKNIPSIYNASDKPLKEAESDELYDLRVLQDIMIQPGQTRRISTRTIQGFTQYLLSLYQDKNYAGIYVYVPADTMKNGRELQDEILTVKVMEASVSEITTTYYNPDNEKVKKGYLCKSAINDWSPAKVGEVVNQKEMDDFINLLNLNPDRYVSGIVSKGTEPNSIALGYNIYEASPWHWFIQADNSGTKPREWDPRIGLINTNLLGIDDTLTIVYQAPWDTTIDENYGLFGSYDFPLLGPRLRLNLYGGHSEFDISSASSPVDFLGRGTFYGGILSYNVLQTDDGWFFDINGSLEHTRSKVNPSLFPAYLGTDIKFWLWGGGFELHRSDDLSQTSVTAGRYESMGGESGGDEFRLARTNADSDFTIYNASAAHSQYLDTNKVEHISASVRWITSDERLVPAKMTAFGGMYTIRGYDEYELVADGGLFASGQYEFDLVKYEESKFAGDTEDEQKKPFLRKLAPLVFVDYGRSKIRHPVGTEKANEDFFSVGAGALIELGDNFSGAVYYGYPLKATDNTREGKGRVSAGVMLKW
jgi:hemolysin activation/secretion protein